MSYFSSFPDSSFYFANTDSSHTFLDCGKFWPQRSAWQGQHQRTQQATTQERMAEQPQTEALDLRCKSATALSGSIDAQQQQVAAALLDSIDVQQQQVAAAFSGGAGVQKQQAVAALSGGASAQQLRTPAAPASGSGQRASTAGATFLFDTQIGISSSGVAHQAQAVSLRGSPEIFSPTAALSLDVRRSAVVPSVLDHAGGNCRQVVKAVGSRQAIAEQYFNALQEQIALHSGRPPVQLTLDGIFLKRYMGKPLTREQSEFISDIEDDDIVERIQEILGAQSGGAGPASCVHNFHVQQQVVHARPVSAITTPDLEARVDEDFDAYWLVIKEKTGVTSEDEADAVHVKKPGRKAIFKPVRLCQQIRSCCLNKPGGCSVHCANPTSPSYSPVPQQESFDADALENQVFENFAQVDDQQVQVESLVDLSYEETVKQDLRRRLVRALSVELEETPAQRDQKIEAFPLALYYDRTNQGFGQADRTGVVNACAEVVDIVKGLDNWFPPTNQDDIKREFMNCWQSLHLDQTIVHIDRLHTEALRPIGGGLRGFIGRDETHRQCMVDIADDFRYMVKLAPFALVVYPKEADEFLLPLLHVISIVTFSINVIVALEQNSQTVCDELRDIRRHFQLVKKKFNQHARFDVCINSSDIYNNLFQLDQLDDGQVLAAVQRFPYVALLFRKAQGLINCQWQIGLNRLRDNSNSDSGRSGGPDRRRSESSSSSSSSTSPGAGDDNRTSPTTPNNTEATSSSTSKTSTTASTNSNKTSSSFRPSSDGGDCGIVSSTPIAVSITPNESTSVSSSSVSIGGQQSADRKSNKLLTGFGSIISELDISERNDRGFVKSASPRKINFGNGSDSDGETKHNRILTSHHGPNETVAQCDANESLSTGATQPIRSRRQRKQTTSHFVESYCIDSDDEIDIDKYEIHENYDPEYRGKVVPFYSRNPNLPRNSRFRQHKRNLVVPTTIDEQTEPESAAKTRSEPIGKCSSRQVGRLFNSVGSRGKIAGKKTTKRAAEKAEKNFAKQQANKDRRGKSPSIQQKLGIKEDCWVAAWNLSHSSSAIKYLKSTSEISQAEQNIRCEIAEVLRRSRLATVSNWDDYADTGLDRSEIINCREAGDFERWLRKKLPEFLSDESLAIIEANLEQRTSSASKKRSVVINDDSTKVIAVETVGGERARTPVPTPQQQRTIAELEREQFRQAYPIRIKTVRGVFSPCDEETSQNAVKTVSRSPDGKFRGPTYQEILFQREIASVPRGNTFAVDPHTQRSVDIAGQLAVVAFVPKLPDDLTLQTWQQIFDIADIISIFQPGQRPEPTRSLRLQAWYRTLTTELQSSIRTKIHQVIPQEYLATYRDLNTNLQPCAVLDSVRANLMLASLQRDLFNRSVLKRVEQLNQGQQVVGVLANSGNGSGGQQNIVGESIVIDAENIEQQQIAVNLAGIDADNEGQQQVAGNPASEHASSIFEKVIKKEDIEENDEIISQQQIVGNAAIDNVKTEFETTGGSEKRQ